MHVVADAVADSHLFPPLPFSINLLNNILFQSEFSAVSAALYSTMPQFTDVCYQHKHSNTPGLREHSHSLSGAGTLISQSCHQRNVRNTPLLMTTVPWYEMERKTSLSTAHLGTHLWSCRRGEITAYWGQTERSVSSQIELIQLYDRSVRLIKTKTESQSLIRDCWIDTRAEKLGFLERFYILRFFKKFLKVLKGILGFSVQRRADTKSRCRNSILYTLNGRRDVKTQRSRSNYRIKCKMY